MLFPTPPRRVGKTNLHVPALGFGSAPLTHPSFTKTVTREEANHTVRYAVSSGLNFIDSAPYYGFGESERVVGEALKDVPRTNYALATKVGRLVVPGERSYFDFSRDGVLRSVDQSLHRLQVDRVDILHIHDPDNYYREALDIAFPILAQLRSEGVIKAIGVGMNQWQMLRDFALNADFDCFLLAGRYTLLEQEALDFLTLCREKQISVFLGGIYNGGILATGALPGALYNYEKAPATVMDRVRRIEAICARYEVPLRSVALQFVAAHPAVTTSIVGLQSPAEVDALIASWNMTIPSALWADLHAEGLIDDKAPIPTKAEA